MHILSVLPLAVMNTSSWIVLLLLAAVVAGIVIYLIRRRKKGKRICSCGGDCGSCPSAGLCHSSEQNDKSS